MTSYTACYKTLLSQKPCISDKKLLWNAIRKLWPLFQSPSWKSACSAPWRRTDDDVVFACNETSLSRKPCMVANKLLWIIIKKSWSLFQKPSTKVRAALPGGGMTIKSCPVGNKTLSSRKPCIADKKLQWIPIMKSWSLRNFYKKTANINLKTYQYINVANGLNRSHKTTNIFISFDSLA